MIRLPLHGKTIDELNGDEVLELVRYSYTLYDQDFTGQLRKGFRDKTPFIMRLKPDSIQFISLIYVDTANKEFSLFERGPKAPVNPGNQANIRGLSTDLSIQQSRKP